MRTLTCLTLLTLLPFAFASAQDIDAGRGAIPLHVPVGYDAANPAPLVVLLHGYTSTGARQDGYMKFGSLADEYGYLFLAPDGTKEESERNYQFWNATEACCNFHESTVDDSAYIRALIEEVKATYNVDPKRVYLIGHSNGGFMTYRMAYDHSETIAAIASLAGASFTDPDLRAPATPVHILQIHGTNDQTIRYEGGNFGLSDYPSAVESVERWAAYNGCAVEATPGDKPLDLERRIDGEETTVMRYVSDCNPNGSAELWTIKDGGHIPSLSDTFNRQVIEWLLAHPKA